MPAAEGIGYGVAGVLTAIDDDLLPHLAGLPTSPVDLCRTAQSLVVEPDVAAGLGIPEERQRDKAVRRASDLIRTLLALDPTPIFEARPPVHRVVGTCRHFTLLSCAFLRHRGVAARARCGFATYFVPGKYVDHWVVEYWHAGDERWVRVDSEILGLPLVATPNDLSEGEFLSGGEAWGLCRRGVARPVDVRRGWRTARVGHRRGAGERDP